MKPLTPVDPTARIALGIGFFVLFFALWGAITLGGFVSKTFLADPLSMLASGWTLVPSAICSNGSRASTRTAGIATRSVVVARGRSGAGVPADSMADSPALGAPHHRTSTARRSPFARSAFGGRPNLRAYSRLNWLGLS